MHKRACPATVPLRVIEQRHKSEVHVQLLMTVKQGPAGIIGHKVDFHFLVSAEHDDILHDPRRRLSGNAGQLKAVAMQMHRVDIVAGIAAFQPIPAALTQRVRWLRVVGERLAIQGPQIEAVRGGIGSRDFRCPAPNRKSGCSPIACQRPSPVLPMSWQML